MISLECWKDRLVDLIKLFQHITFDLVYRDDNTEADNLSKQALQKQQGKSSIFKVLRNMRVLLCLLNFFRSWAALVFPVGCGDMIQRRSSL